MKRSYKQQCERRSNMYNKKGKNECHEEKIKKRANDKYKQIEEKILLMKMEGNKRKKCFSHKDQST